MKRFLWFNIEKLKEDPDYFLVIFLFLIIIQLAFYFPLDKSQDFGDIVFGISTSIFFIYTLFCKKKFTYKDIWKCF